MKINIQADYDPLKNFQLI